jgi:hypothetical protein
MADDRDRARLAGESVAQRGRGGAGRKGILDADRRPGGNGYRPRSLPGAHERARQHEPRRFRQRCEPGSEIAGLPEPLPRQLAQLVRLSGRGPGMPAEVDPHEQQDRDNPTFIRV